MPLLPSLSIQKSSFGVDRYEKLLLVKESKSNADLKRARKLAQFFTPKEVYVIEDNNEAIHKSFAQRPPDSIESKKESSSILNLLDEELEVSFFLFHAAFSPKRNSIADDHNNNLTGKYHITIGSSVTINLTDESIWFLKCYLVTLSYLPSEHEAFSFKSLTEEAIFDHIRKKNWPSVNQPGSSNATLGTSKDAMIISEPEPGELNRDACGTKVGTKAKNNVLQGSSGGANGELAVSPKVSSTKTGTSSNSKHLADLGSSIQDGRKDKPFPSDSKRQCRSLASTDQAREVDSFLGFQSVFSFL
ncbi:hypothetical protein E1A91_D06G064600v1 [Gossypium mustelinum]|uniref:Uncharacterized protein n=1 Tax=Gossypium mustelinum TaxID=34275 RepID=A0A5D2UHN9_GOSMU|nr:hypothetical protein E1A91_D06G064600v1 [Gossypium mustelinum]